MRVHGHVPRCSLRSLEVEFGSIRVVGTCAMDHGRMSMVDGRHC